MYTGPLVQGPSKAPAMVSDYCATFKKKCNMAIWLLDQTIFAADFLPKLTRPEPVPCKVNKVSHQLSFQQSIVHTPL